MRTETKKLGEGSTPGPWEVSSDGIDRGAYGDFRHIHIRGPHFKPSKIGTAEADCLLISKAPLLIEARELLHAYEQVALARLVSVESTEFAAGARVRLEQIRALLAKLED